MIRGFDTFEDKREELIIKESYEGVKITSIRANAFMGAAGVKLTKVVFPDSPITIGARAFFTNKITSLDLGNSITSIGDEAFHRNNIAELTIPDSITSIGKDAFSRN